MPSDTPPPLPRAWCRLHPLSPVVSGLETAAGFAIPIVLVLFFSRGSRLELLVFLSLVPSLVFGVARYLAFGYRLEEEEIVVREGIFRRTVRHVPYERIQNLDLSRNVIQRVFRLTQLSLETASGTEPEAVFRWVAESEVREIEERVTGARNAPPLAGAIPSAPLPTGPETGMTTLHQVPLPDLVLLGFFSLRGFALFTALAGLAWQFDFFERPGTIHWMRSLPERWADLSGFGIALPLVAGFAILFVVSIVSIVLTVVENYGFRLSDAGPELRTRVGLLTQHASTIPKGRIQILEFLAPLHLRPFRRVRVWAGTAGGRAQETAGRSWLLPIIRRAQLDGALSAIQPVAILPDEAWLRVHPKAGRRMQRRAMLWILIFSATLFWQVGIASLLALLVAPFALLYASRTARRLGYAVTEDALFARHGWLFQRTQIVRLSKIQSAAVTQSPFDRRWKMATLQVDTASPAKGQLHVAYLPEEVATVLQRHLSSEASRRHFHW